MANPFPLTPRNDAGPLSSEDARIILSLRLLIARAANQDSLAWWDDEVLTLHAGFLLERLFPIAPPLAARSLSLQAALSRHEAACAADDSMLHLYRLDPDNQDKLALRFAPLLPVPVPAQPITAMDALKQHLLDLVGEPLRYKVVRRTDTHGFQLEIPRCPPGVSPLRPAGPNDRRWSWNSRTPCGRRPSAFRRTASGNAWSPA